MFKRLLSIFYRNNYQNEDNEICGEILYRSKDKLHIFNFEIKRHYIVFDLLEDLENEIQNRSEDYPFDKPTIVFVDKTNLLMCEELVERSNAIDNNVLEIISSRLSKSKYIKKQSVVLEDYLASYEFKNEQVARLLREKLLSQLKPITKISLCFSQGDIGPGNVLISKDKVVAIDWEVAGLAPFYYDFIHYLMSEYIRYGNAEGLKNYFNGVYDNYLDKIFKMNDEIFDSSLRQTYYYICILTRLILFIKKDGTQFENMLVNDNFWLKFSGNEK